MIFNGLFAALQTKSSLLENDILSDGVEDVVVSVVVLSPKVIVLGPVIGAAAHVVAPLLCIVELVSGIVTVLLIPHH